MIPATTDVLLVRPGRPQQKGCRILVISCHFPPDPTIGAKWRHATKGQSNLRRDAYDREGLVSQKADTQRRNPAVMFTDPGAGGIPWIRREERRCMEDEFGWEYVGQ
jgi:hypothetical protein